MMSPTEGVAHPDDPMAEAEFDAGAEILHHIQDATWVELPTVMGIDLSITKHVAMMWFASLILIVIFGLAARRAKDPVPSGLRNLLEILILFIRDDVVRKAIPTHSERYTPYLLTTFFFILACNLLGLVPGMATATGNIAVTATLALFAFLVIQLGGIREYGFAGHIKNLTPGGLPFWLVPIIFLIEFLGMFIKPFALCIRLFANMMAGHVMILALVSLIFLLGPIVIPLSVGFTLFINLLELFVAFLQAYVFTVLTANFIGMSVHPAH